MMRYGWRLRPEPTSEEFLTLLILLDAFAYVVRWTLGEGPGRRLGVQPEPGSTPGLKTFRNLRRGRGPGDRCHPRQRLMRYQIRAGARVGNDRLSKIGSAVAAEIAAVAELRPELLRRVGSTARLAERHRMVRTQREEQRSESNEHQQDARIVVLETRACQAG